MSKMYFRNYGGDYQLRIEEPDDLENVLSLDEAHWAAMSAPISGLNSDSAFLTFLDADRNARIRTDEVKAGVKWLFRMLANRSHLAEQTDVLKLADIDTSHPEGKQLHAASELILSNLKVLKYYEISLSQVRDLKNILASAANNGDGVIPPDATDDPDLRAFIAAIADSIGSAPDASGQNGITTDHLNTFMNESKAYIEWESKGHIPTGNESTDVMPWGNATTSAWQLICGIEEKIEQYFTLCDVVRFDSRTAQELELQKMKLDGVDFSDRTALEAKLSDSPIAPPSPDGILDLTGELNPLFEKRLCDLRESVLKHALGESVAKINREEWQKVKSIFSAYQAWLNGKQGAKVEKLGKDQLAKWLEGSNKEKVSEMIAADQAVASELEQIQNVEKLILYQKCLFEFANSFVSFPRLYDPNKRSLFEMGTLVIGGKELTFSVKVDNRAAHKTQAHNSNMYILYVEVTGKKDKDIEEKFEVVAGLTSGNSVGFQIGKRGVFITPDDREWDARVVDIVENPVSMWEAFKAPFKKASGFVSKQADKFSKTQQAKIEGAASAPRDSTATRDLLLVGTVGIAAVGSAFAYITKALSEVNPIHVLIVLLGIAAVVFIPSFLMGYIKLRRRDLTCLLEASGWAINIRIRLTGRMGRLFTRQPFLPKGARKERKDIGALFARQFGPKPISWKRVAFTSLILIVIILAAMLYVTLRYFV